MYWLKTQFLQNPKSRLLNVTATVGDTLRVFTPQKLANTANQGFAFFLENWLSNVCHCRGPSDI